MNFLRLIGFACLMFSLHAPADQHLDTSRLIIAFHENDYMALGGAAEATDYINSRWGEHNMISLVRPLGNSTILVELIEGNISSLNRVVDDLSQMPKIRYVEKDTPVDSASGLGTSIPSIQ